MMNNEDFLNIKYIVGHDGHASKFENQGAREIQHWFEDQNYPTLDQFLEGFAHV